MAALTLTDKNKVMSYPAGDMAALMDLEIAQGKIKTVGELLSVDDHAIAVSKENPRLTEKINKALEEIIADGTYEEISKKWFGFDLMETGKE